MRRLVLLVPVLAALAGQASAQSVISARSGLVNFLEGVVFLDGQPLMRRSGAFARMHDGSVLTTEDGRAEVLLTPDTYIRIGEHSGIRMVSNDISNTQVELLSGSAILDSAKAAAGDLVRVSFRDAGIHFLKPGHYRMDAEPPQLRVYDGEAEVKRDGRTTQLETSQLLPLDGASVVKKFTRGSDGLLDLWSEERGDLIASRMLSAAAISDPLLDSGPGVPADFASYVGYIPPVSLPLPSTGLAPPPLGWGGLGFGYGGYYPSFYPALGFAEVVVRPATFLSVTRRPITIFVSRPPVSGITITPPRTVIMPRPGISIAPGQRSGAPIVLRPARPAVGRR